MSHVVDLTVDSPVQDDEDDDVDSDADSEDDEEEEDNEATSMAEDRSDEGDDATMTDQATMPTTASLDGGGDRAVGEDGSSVGSGGVVWVKAVPNLDRLYGLREMGREALCFQLSSAKPGNGVEQIRDCSTDTYWQSDGNSQPHWIQVSFGRRVAISHVCLYLDFALDESYTPRRVQVQVGMTDQDLISAMHPPMTQVEFQEPTGWCIIPLSSPTDPLDDCYNTSKQGVVRAHLIRISILSMHQNGRDTHVRQVQLYGPRMIPSSTPNNTQESSGPAPVVVRASPQDDSFQTVEFSQFSTCR